MKLRKRQTFTVDIEGNKIAFTAVYIIEAKPPGARRWAPFAPFGCDDPFFRTEKERDAKYDEIIELMKTNKVVIA